LARILTYEGEAQPEIRKRLARSFQSGHINLLLGSGASMPSVPAAGAIEAEIAALALAGEGAQAQARMYEFLASVREPTNRLIANTPDQNDAVAIASYTDYLRTIETILTERRTTLLPKQATVFTTNYDLLVERASLNCLTLRLNDGFSRVPSLNNRMEYSPRNFFTTTFNTGNLYAYKVEIPSVNLIKLHGSLSWRRDHEAIVFEVQERQLLPADRTEGQIAEFLNAHSVVLPQLGKFQTTVLDRTYYELLRIYANELDRENTLLVAFGFSFSDEHVLDITKRALQNPTLRLVIFAFNAGARDLFAQRFAEDANVDVVALPANEEMSFETFNAILRGSLPYEDRGE